mgnify:CR=1 FL=1
MTNFRLNKKKEQTLLSKNRLLCDAAVNAAIAASYSGMYEISMRWADFAAELCWKRHPGYFTHPQLEMALQHTGNRLEGSGQLPVPSLPLRKAGVRSFLHVLTTALEIGGHTKLVERMISSTHEASGDVHSIVLTSQSDSKVPDWLKRAAESTGGVLLALPEDIGLAERSLVLRRLAWEQADVVVLHIHPNDPVAPVAFAKKGGPRVVFLNHADHLFWIGAGCADVIADIRSEGQEITLRRRGKPKSVILPIPLVPSSLALSRANARSLLGVAEKTPLLIAIASSYKFIPYGTLDFPAYSKQILERNQNAVLCVVGPSEEEPEWRDAVDSSSGRLRLLGVKPDVEVYYAAADLFLESFPVGSLTSTIDAMLNGVPVVRAPRDILPILALGDYDGLLPQPSSQEEYLQQVDTMLGDHEFRKSSAASQRKAVLEKHTGKGWLSKWEELIGLLPEIHNPPFLHGKDCLKSAEKLDKIWAEMEKRQFADLPDQEDTFKGIVRTLFIDCRRGELFRMWRSAVIQGNWRVARVLFRDVVRKNRKL